MSPTLLLVLVLLGAAYAGLILPTLFRLMKGCTIEDLSPEWFERFSTRSYYPMERLLSSEDFAFLSTQPGFDPALYRKFRRDRLRIFRQYLNRMIFDFNRLHLAARLVISQSQHDSSELFKQLLILRIRFTFSVIEAQSRYALCWFGLRTVNVRRLILQLEQISAFVGKVTQSPDAVPAAS